MRVAGGAMAVRRPSPSWTAEVQGSSVRCVFVPDVAAGLMDLGEALTRDRRDLRIVVRPLADLPERERLLDALVEALAEAALLLWPNWYEYAIPSIAEDYQGDDDLSRRLTARRLAHQLPGFNAEWFDAAALACQAGRTPRLPPFAVAIQVRQLSLALATQQLVLLVGIGDVAAPPERLSILARAAEWLAREAAAAVVLVLPRELADRPELDSVNYGAIRYEGLPQEQVGLGGASQEQKHRICPIVGRPHPASPGELRLAERLQTDPLLGRLFRFNQWVTTVFGNHCLVDLLWDEGRVAVEIDGYGYHSARAAFNADRQRDYELNLSGYLVLRLPHDLVLEDVELAAERMREFVAFRRNHPFMESEASV